ncbi:MAG: PorP/SprF family type IX secretion system membrane protein [Flavobacteriales bacterium]
MKQFYRDILILIVFLSLSIIGVYAQDAHLSQYSVSPMTLNPAMTGMFDNEFKAHLQYRSQWNSLTNNPFVTSHVAYEQPHKKFGFGGYILNNRAGVGNFNVFNFVLSRYYNIFNDTEGDHKLTTGVQLGFIQKSVDINALTFDNQYNPDIGGFDRNIANGENIENSSVLLPELNLGLFYKYNDESKDYKPFIGISGFHLTQPEETFLGAENKLPMRLTSFGGLSYSINDKIELEPTFLFMNQENNNELITGAKGYYAFDESGEKRLYLGTYYRNKDAFVAQTGIEWGEYRLGFSYDVNTSSLSSYTNNKGAFEISFTYSRFKRTHVPSIL